MIGKISADEKSLKDLLTGNLGLFHVPDFQRDYQWTVKKHIPELWEDLYFYHKNNSERNHYFIGNVVFYERDKRWEIIDGQQRLVTLILLFCAIRNKFNELGEEKNKNDMDKYINKGDFDKELLSRVKLSYNKDRIPFEHLQNPENSTPIQNNTRISKCYSFLKEKIDEFCENYSTSEEQNEKLIELSLSLLEKVYFVRTIVPNIEIGYEVFETMNSAGKPLSIADLTKTKLFQLAHKHTIEEDVIPFWNDIENDYVDHEVIENYLFRYWLSKFLKKEPDSEFYQKVPKKELYSEICSEINQYNAKKLINFVKELQVESKNYLKITNPKTNEANYTSLADLNNCAFKQHIPLLLSAYVRDDITDTNIKDILHFIEVIYIRHYVIAGASPSQLESNFANWAMKLRKVGKNYLPTFQKEVKQTVPEDYEFFRSFITKTLTNNNAIQYIFRKIERFECGEEKDYVAPPQTVWIEHILPQSLQGEWTKSFTYELHVQCVNRIGNLTLLIDSKNISAGNKPFDEKKLRYNQSKIEITKELSKNKDWAEKEIIERSKKLAKCALLIWNLDEKQYSYDDIQKNELFPQDSLSVDYEPEEIEDDDNLEVEINFACCPRCGKEAQNKPDVIELFGLRYGGTKPQSWCIECRSRRE